MARTSTGTVMGCLDTQCCYRQEGLRNNKEALHHGSRCNSQDSNPVNNTVVFQNRVAKTCVCVAVHPVRDVNTPCTVGSVSDCLNSTRLGAKITRFAAGRCRLTCGLM